MFRFLNYVHIIHNAQFSEEIIDHFPIFLSDFRYTEAVSEHPCRLCTAHN